MIGILTFDYKNYAVLYFPNIHNNLRDLISQMLHDSRCRDVEVEPGLLPVNPQNFKPSTNTQDEARLDIAATGFISAFERTFFDVRVTHPNCDTNLFKPLSQLYSEHESEKKRTYEERVIEAEKGSFIPLVFSTSGGMGPLCRTFFKKLAHIIAEDNNERYEDVIHHLRVRTRYALLRSTLMALRGQRGRKLKKVDPISETSFNLIPEHYVQRVSV